VIEIARQVRPSPKTPKRWLFACCMPISTRHTSEHWLPSMRT
jgi:hypothetical protein